MGLSGLPGVMTQCLPNAQQQRCTTHKVRGMARYLTYQQLSSSSEAIASNRSLPPPFLSNSDGGNKWGFVLVSNSRTRKKRFLSRPRDGLYFCVTVHSPPPFLSNSDGGIKWDFVLYSDKRTTSGL